MAAKKRNTLRNKAAARLGGSVLSPDAATAPVLDLPEDPKAFLHQYKETKREKQTNKQTDFLSKIRQGSGRSDPAFEGISKSSVRRRKRKMRDNLKPRLDDLLVSLQKEEDLNEFTKEPEDAAAPSTNPFAPKTDAPHIKVTRIVEKIEPGSVKIKRNEPNIRNQKGAKMLAVKERQRFNEVLTNQVFQQNSFSALRDIIKMQKK